MKLADNFYHILAFNENEEGIQVEVQLNADHHIFEGHFPNNPVTPGVVQMEMIKELVGMHFKRDMQLVSAGNVKFLAILNPLETAKITVTTSIQETPEGHVKFNAGITSGDQSFLKYSGVFA